MISMTYLLQTPDYLNSAFLTSTVKAVRTTGPESPLSASPVLPVREERAWPGQS